MQRMYRLTDIISKPVVSIAEGKQIGTTESAVFNRRLSKLKFISVFDLELEDKVYIPSSLILSMDKEAIMVKGLAEQERRPEENCPINAPIYDEEGGLLGRAADIILNEDFSVSQIEIAGGGSITPQNIISFSKHTIVACFDVEKAKRLRKMKSQRAKAKKEEEKDEGGSIQDTIAQVMELLPLGLSAAEKIYESFSGSDEDKSEEYGPPQDSQPEDIQPQEINPENQECCDTFDEAEEEAAPPEHEIRRIVPPFSYLIGRKATSDIYGLSDKPLIKKDTLITAKHIDLCRRHGKLISLAKNSKPVERLYTVEDLQNIMKE